MTFSSNHFYTVLLLQMAAKTLHYEIEKYVIKPSLSS